MHTKNSQEIPLGQTHRKIYFKDTGKAHWLRSILGTRALETVRTCTALAFSRTSDQTVTSSCFHNRPPRKQIHYMAQKHNPDPWLSKPMAIDASTKGPWDPSPCLLWMGTSTSPLPSIPLRTEPWPIKNTFRTQENGQIRENMVLFMSLSRLHPSTTDFNSPTRHMSHADLWI